MLKAEKAMDAITNSCMHYQTPNALVVLTAGREGAVI